jgi:hypothetical protein
VIQKVEGFSRAIQMPGSNRNHLQAPEIEVDILRSEQRVARVSLWALPKQTENGGLLRKGYFRGLDSDSTAAPTAAKW